MTDILQQTKKIGVRERIRLVQKIWDSIVEDTEDLPVPEWHKKELERRHAKYIDNPDPVLSWNQVKENVRHKNI